MNYVCTSENTIYELILSQLMVSWLIINAHLAMSQNVEPESPSIDLAVLHWPFDYSWF